MGNTFNTGRLINGLFVDASGNVGIGTTTLTQKLNINGSIRLVDGNADGPQLVLASSGFSDWNLDNFSGRFRAYYGATEYFTISASGNVGIGTSNPSGKLNIIGGELRWGFTSDLGVLSYSDNKPILASVGATDFLFYTNGLERLRIGSGGNVLIGTTSDDGNKLQVNGNISSSRIFTSYSGIKISGYGALSQTISGQMTILGHNIIADTSAGNTVTVMNSGWYSSMIKQYYNEGITFHTSTTVYNAGDVYPMTSTERMRITSDGNVGIGTSVPQYSLSLPQDSKIGWNDAGSAKRGSITVNSSADAMVFTTGTSDTERMRITSSGNVGINTSAPSQKLHVIGGFLQTAGNSSWYRNVFERNVTSWDNIIGFTPQSSPQYTYGYINITASAYVNGTGSGGATSSRWYYAIANNSISVSVVGTDITSGTMPPSVRLVVSSGNIYVQAQSNNGSSTSYTTIYVDAMLSSGYVNGTYWLI